MIPTDEPLASKESRLRVYPSAKRIADVYVFGVGLRKILNEIVLMNVERTVNIVTAHLNFLFISLEDELHIWGNIGRPELFSRYH